MILALFVVVLECVSLASQFGGVPPPRAFRDGRSARSGGNARSGGGSRGGGSSRAGGNPRSGGFLSRKDQDFVGDDPVLAAELARRIAVSTRGEIPELKETPTISDLVRLCQEGMLPSFDCPPREQDPVKIASARRQHWSPVKGEGHFHRFKQFPQDYNATNLYAVQLKIAEHAIYATQARLQEFERVTQRHTKDDRFRMSYMSAKVEGWSNDLTLLFDYSHKNSTWKERFVWSWKHRWWHINTHEDPWIFSTYKHLMYYQLMLRRYLDIIYTQQMMRDIHEKLHKKFTEEASIAN